MSDFISIHDTHKLPYKNAVITAKTVQSGNTTPLKFINALDDEEMGYEIYTNADGYLCDANGTLFTKGVYVKENAYITMTLRSGGSTSWIVRSDSDVVVNDGKLLGKKVPRDQQSPNEEYVLYGGEWRLVLHSANTDKTRELLFNELAGVPNFNEWNEAEQVEMLAGDKNVSVGIYTKTMLLLWDAEVTPGNRSPIYVTLSAERAGQRSRFAQHCIVMNATPYRITLKDEQSGQTIGSIDPSGGTLNIGLFFIQDESTGNWVVDEDLVSFNATDEVDGDRVKLTGAPTNGFFNITVNDRTPSTLIIEADAVNLSAIPTPGEIPVKLVAESGKLTKPKRVTLWFVNVGGGNVDSLPLKVYVANNVLCVLYPATLCELLVPALGENAGFTDSFGPILLDNSEKAATNVCSKMLTGGTQFKVPLKCQQMGLTVVGTGDSNIIFQNTQQVVRFDVVNNTGSPVWFNLQAEDATTQLNAVCPANKSCRFIVRNDYGKLTAVSETKSYPTGVTSEHVSTYTHDVNVTYDIRGLATQLVINCGALNRESGAGIGQHSDCRTRVYLDVSGVIVDGTQHHLEVDMASFISDANQDYEGIVIHLGPSSAGYDHSQEITRAEKMAAEGEDRYYLDPAIISFDAYKNGTDTLITNKHYR